MTGWTETSETGKRGGKRPKDGGGESEPCGELQRRCRGVQRKRKLYQTKVGKQTGFTRNGVYFQKHI